MYGPFWIATCLIFCLFAFGNLSGSGIVDNYEYELLSKAFSLVYGYLLLVPFITYCVVKFLNCNCELF